MTDSGKGSEGLRERKRRATLERIADAGLRLILERGYEETTLDAIAEAAGISRRTFFYYFSSKEEILLAWQSAVGSMIHAAILRERADRPPIDVVLSAILSLASEYDPEKMIAIEKLLQSTDQLRARKHAKYVEQEDAVFTALCKHWPDRKRRNGLRMVAMASVGGMRVAVDRWAAGEGRGRLESHLEKAFSELKREVGQNES